jgi:threonine aldolase
MDAAAAQTYARLFRMAGTLLGKGNIARALETLKQGHAIAQSRGDHAMARRFAQEIERVTPPAK